MEVLERVHLLAGAEQLDRLAGDVTHRQRGTAAAVAVGTGQHDAGDADAVVEILGEVDRVLPCQGVGDEQDLVGVRGRLDLGHLGHQRFVDVGTAGGVQHHHVVALQARGLLGPLRDLDRCLANHDRQRVDADLAAEDGELLLSGRPLHVERGHQDALLLPVEEALGDLGSGRRLAGALEADHHDRDRRRGIERDRVDGLAQRLDQHIVDDLDDHLAGRDRLDDVGADGPAAHLVDEALDHVERHVGLEQRAPNLAQGDVHVLLGERAALGQSIEDAGEFVAETFEHPDLIRQPGLPTQNAPGGATRCRAGPLALDRAANPQRGCRLLRCGCSRGKRHETSTPPRSLPASKRGARRPLPRAQLRDHADRYTGRR